MPAKKATKRRKENETEDPLQKKVKGMLKWIVLDNAVLYNSAVINVFCRDVFMEMLMHVSGSCV